MAQRGQPEPGIRHRLAVHTLLITHALPLQVQREQPLEYKVDKGVSREDCRFEAAVFLVEDSSQRISDEGLRPPLSTRNKLVLSERGRA